MSVKTARHKGVLVTTMDDGKANALTFEAIAAVREAIAEAAGKGHPLVLAGREGKFCAGFDLGVMRGGDAARVRELLTAGARLFRDICEAPIPVVAACAGHALAGGALLLLCADQRIASPGHYEIGLNEVRIGMPLPEFAVALARHRMPAARLSMATMFGYTTGPEEACAIGYLDRVAEDPLRVALDIAAALGELSGKAFSTTKKRVRQPLLERFDALGM